MENRKFMSLNDYIEEFNKSGEKDFYAFLDKNKKQALENRDEELAEYIEAISSQAYEEQKEYEEYMQEEYEREEKRKQKEAEYQDYDGEELLDSESNELENNNNEEETIEKTEEDIRNSIIKKVQNLIEHFEEPYTMNEIKLSEEEHSIFIEMIANNPNTQLNGNYIMDTYRKEYSDESYYHEATAEEQAEMDKINGNDYLSIKIGENLYLNEDFNRYRRISSIKIENDCLHGDTEKKYGEEEFYIDEIITPEDLIEGMHDKTKELSSLSVEELQEIVNGNDEQISLNDDEIKQALIQRILEQQKTIAKQKEEISRLKSQKELE